MRDGETYREGEGNIHKWMQRKRKRHRPTTRER